MKKENTTKLDYNNRSRRALTRKMLISGGVIGGIGSIDKKWIKPMLKEAVLPVHADLSQDVW